MGKCKMTLVLLLYLSLSMGIVITPYPNYIPKLIKDLDHPNLTIRENATELLMMHRWYEISSFLPECGSPEMIVRLKRIERELRPEYYTTKFKPEDEPIKIQWKKYWW